MAFGRDLPVELDDSFADSFAVIGGTGSKTALRSGGDLDRCRRRGPLFRRGRVRIVYWDQEEVTEVAEPEPSFCRGASAIRRGPGSAGGGTGATGPGGAGVGAGAVAGTGESAPSFLESSFFGLMYGPRLLHHGTDAVARAKLALPNGLLKVHPNAAGAPSRRFPTSRLHFSLNPQTIE